VEQLCLELVQTQEVIVVHVEHVSEVKLGFRPHDLVQETDSEDACDFKRHEFNVSIYIPLFREFVFLFLRQSKSVREEMTTDLSMGDLWDGCYYDKMSK